MSEPRIEFRLPEFDNIEHVLKLGDTAIEQESQAALVSLARIESALAAAEAELETLRAELRDTAKLAEQRRVKLRACRENHAALAVWLTEWMEKLAAALSSDGATTCLNCGNKSVRPNGGGFSCRDCGWSPNPGPEPVAPLSVRPTGEGEE